jgi:hypothetical protein
MMKILGLILLAVLVCGPVIAGQPDSTIKVMRSDVYEQLGMDTTGPASLPIYMANKFSQRGIDKTGWDLGQEVSKQIISTANKSAVAVDTALIRVVGMAYDSGGYPVRWLREVPIDSLTKMVFSGAITPEKNATHYAAFGDSVYLGPTSGNADTFNVLYYKKYTYPTDTTTANPLPVEYRRVAIAWACYEASEKLNNGRAEEFLKRYAEMVAALWGARYGKTGK